jgi:hypothetical protein
MVMSKLKKLIKYDLSNCYEQHFPSNCIKSLEYLITLQEKNKIEENLIGEKVRKI